MVYDPKANRLRLAKAVFACNEVHRETKEEVNEDEEYENTVIGGKESDLPGTAIFGGNMDNSDCLGNSASVPNSFKFFN